MNVYDSDKMAQLLKPLGYGLTEDPSEADIAILNTCHIREKAEHKVFSDLGRLRAVQKERQEQGDRLLIGVTGCTAQAQGEEILTQAPYVDFVVGPQTYHRLPEIITQVLRKKGEKLVDIDFPEESKFDFLILPEQSPISTFLSIQEGCDKFCTFCVVPYTRGAEYSRPVDDILKEARILVERGSREITLLGQNVNAYHGQAPLSSHGVKEWSLARLIEALSDIDGLERIRYTTSHPKDMDEDLIKAHGAFPKLMPFLHLPVQSGSNRILEAMNRKHTVSRYLEIIEALRESRSDLALSTDIIVGFPGESDQDFQDTLDLVRKVFYAQAFSFKYSQRPGTPGAVMDQQVPETLKSERLQILQTLLFEQQTTFNKSKEGQILEVLFEKDGRHDNQIIGRSPYLQSVYIETTENLLGRIVPVSIEKGTQNSLYGSLSTKAFAA